VPGGVSTVFVVGGGVVELPPPPQAVIAITRRIPAIVRTMTNLVFNLDFI
jgi:hypothetical protein